MNWLSTSSWIFHFEYRAWRVHIWICEHASCTCTTIVYMYVYVHDLYMYTSLYRCTVYIYMYMYTAIISWMLYRFMKFHLFISYSQFYGNHQSVAYKRLWSDMVLSPWTKRRIHFVKLNLSTTKTNRAALNRRALFRLNSFWSVMSPA